MPVATYPSVALSQTSTFTLDQRIIESQFGDGYSARVGDGMNSFFTVIRLVHDNITATEYQTLLAFWYSVGKVAPFNVTDPTTGAVVKARFTEPLQVTALSGNLYSVSVGAKQTFDI